MYKGLLKIIKAGFLFIAIVYLSVATVGTLMDDFDMLMRLIAEEGAIGKYITFGTISIIAATMIDLLDD